MHEFVSLFYSFILYSALFLSHWPTSLPWTHSVLMSSWTHSLSLLSINFVFSKMITHDFETQFMMFIENSGNYITYKLILEELTSLQYGVKLAITKLLEIDSWAPMQAECTQKKVSRTPTNFSSTKWVELLCNWIGTKGMQKDRTVFPTSLHFVFVLHKMWGGRKDSMRGGC